MNSTIAQLYQQRFALFSTQESITASPENVKPTQEKPKSSIQTAFSGMISGLCTTILLHPFEVVKIRMQSDATLAHKQSWRDLWQQTRTAGLYNGAGANVLASTLAWGIYFSTFEKIKHAATSQTQHTLPHTIAVDFASSLCASTIAQTFTNPIWVLKTRMCLQNVALPGSQQQHRVYSGVLSGLKTLYAEEGLQGFFKGFSANMVGMVHGAVVMVVYQQLRHNIPQYTLLEERTGWLNLVTTTSVAAFMSKVIATLLTYPTQVVRTRMQDHRHDSNAKTSRSLGLVETLRMIWKNNGIKGLYRGISVQIARASVANMLIFSVFESVQKLIKDSLPK